MRNHWEARYTESHLPWDSGITPPEVVAFWGSNLGQSLPKVGKMLDIGCGTGTNLAYLAELGHTAIGIELSGNALAIAAERHKRLDSQLRQRICMIQGSAAAIPCVGANFDYILDIGCLHGVPLPERSGYARGIVENLRSGGYYQLYGFDRAEADSPSERADANQNVKQQDDEDLEVGRGLGKDEVEILLGPAMSVVSIVQANPNPKPCRWYLFRKL